MEVILLENVTNLGVLGDKVAVKRGYGRNYLIPLGKAVPATADRIAEFESRRSELEKKAKDLLAAAEKRMAALSEISVTIEQKAGDEGKLFGSIGTQQIADAVTAAGAELLKAEVRLPDGAIRNVGEFDIAVQLHSDVSGTVKLIVAAE